MGLRRLALVAWAAPLLGVHGLQLPRRPLAPRSLVPRLGHGTCPRLFEEGRCRRDFRGRERGRFHGEGSSLRDNVNKITEEPRVPSPERQNEPGGGGVALLVVLMLIVVKSTTDILTNYTVRPPAQAMALCAELAVFPVIIAWLMSRNLYRNVAGRPMSPERAEKYTVRGVFAAAARDNPQRLAAIGLVYALDNLVYFYALSNLGAATYCVLAQTKIFFTATFLKLRGMVDRFSFWQMVGMACLFVGAVMVSLKDVAVGAAAVGGNKALGIGAVLVGQVASAYANVAYEASLKEGSGNMWVRNVQLTTSISLWLILSNVIRGVVGGTGSLSIAETWEAFKPQNVQFVVLLKALSAIAIAATFKYGGNLLYAFSKPWPVVVAAVAAFVATGSRPPLLFVAGVACSVGGMTLYYASKAKKPSK